MTFFKSIGIIWLVCFVAITCAQSTRPQLSFGFPKGDTARYYKKLRFWGTQYFIPELRSKGKVPFMDAKGRYLGYTADTCDFCEAALEGTVILKDASGAVVVLNFETYGDSSVVDCSKCKRFSKSSLDVKRWGLKRWFVSSGYGNGVKGYHLVPFRTVAVDPAFIAYGSVLYIPAARGVSVILSDGTTIVHDGYFFAGDTGSAIVGNHIDFFTGTSKLNPFKAFLKSTSQESFVAYLVPDTAIVKTLRNSHTQK